MFIPESGLRDEVSDIVARGTFSPTNWLDVTYRTRLDSRRWPLTMRRRSLRWGWKSSELSGGYIYTNTNPYSYYEQAAPPPLGNPYYFPRNEVTLGVSSKWGFYRFNGTAVRDVATNQMVSAGADAIYEDECFIFDLRLYRRYTDINGDKAPPRFCFY